MYTFSLIDLVPVSSTVIPLYTYHVNSTNYHPLSLDDEYRIAYLKHMLKKHKKDSDDPDTLITCNFSHHLMFKLIMFSII